MNRPPSSGPSLAYMWPETPVTPSVIGDPSWLTSLALGIEVDIESDLCYSVICPPSI